MQQASVEGVADFYGATLPELCRIGDEIRTRCFLNCGRQKRTDDRALSIQAGDGVKKWQCSAEGCTKRGDLISLCDLLKPDQNGGGSPRGGRFLRILADLREMLVRPLRGDVPEQRESSRGGPRLIQLPEAPDYWQNAHL